MAGLFDFKSAEEILQERRAATKANQQQLLSTIVATAPKESRQASMLGAQLGMALGRAMGGKSEKEQLQEFREMGGTIEEMQKEAGDNLQDPRYGANVLRQAQAEEQRRLGLLPQEMQQSEKLRIGMERVPEDLDLVGKYKYMAKAFQDAGFTARAAQAALLADKEAQRQLEAERLLEQQNNMTSYQQAQVELAKQRLAQEAAIYGIGTDATTPPTPPEEKPSPDKLLVGAEVTVDGVPHIKTKGGFVPVSDIEALEDAGITAQPGSLESIKESLLTPFNFLADLSASQQADKQIEFVKNALKRNAFRPEDKVAARAVANMPPEQTGLTEAQHKLLGSIARGGL